MCGIVGYIGQRDSVPIILDALRRLEYRGYDSAGIAVIDSGGKLAGSKAEGKLSRLAERLNNGASLSGAVGVGHTRWATHGAPSDANAHPHLDCHGRIAVVHNGIIENYAALRARLLELGHVFSSETDTEVLAHLIEAPLRRRSRRGGAPHRARSPRRIRAGRDLERRSRPSRLRAQWCQPARDRHRRGRDVRRFRYAGDSSVHAARDHLAGGRDRRGRRATVSV